MKAEIFISKEFWNQKTLKIYGGRGGGGNGGAAAGEGPMRLRNDVFGLGTMLCNCFSFLFKKKKIKPCG